MSNKVYIAVSLDGYIADKDDSVDWLGMVPATDELTADFPDFMETIDCLVMGKNTFMMVVGLGEWAYEKKVFVVSSSMRSIPSGYEDRAALIKGTPSEIVSSLHDKGYKDLYIDGGKTIQNFLDADLIDEMIISVVPILLGGGKRLFGELKDPKEFQLVETKVLSNMLVQSHYKRK